MSVNYTTHVVNGFKLEIEKVDKLVNKFDSFTGDPIVESVYSHDIAKINGIEVGSNEIEIDSLLAGEKLGDLEKKYLQEDYFLEL